MTPLSIRIAARIVGLVVLLAPPGASADSPGAGMEPADPCASRQPWRDNAAWPAMAAAVQPLASGRPTAVSFDPTHAWTASELVMCSNILEASLKGGDCAPSHGLVTYVLGALMASPPAHPPRFFFRYARTNRVDQERRYEMMVALSNHDRGRLDRMLLEAARTDPNREHAVGWATIFREAGVTAGIPLLQTFANRMRPGQQRDIVGFAIAALRHPGECALILSVPPHTGEVAWDCTYACTGPTPGFSGRSETKCPETAANPNGITP